MMPMRLALLASVCAVGVGSADARPVSYPGGWTVMQRNTGDFSSLHLHYSPTFQDSIGGYAEQNWADDYTFVGAQYNRLMRRWNAPGSQANLYLNLGAGYAESFDGSEQDLAGVAG